MSEYIKKSSIIGLAHKMQFGRILSQREVEVVEMVVNSVHDDAQVDLVRCGECKWYKEGKLLGPTKFCFRLRDADGERIGYNFASDDFCSRGERKEEEDE